MKYDDLMALVEQAAQSRVVLRTPRGALFTVSVEHDRPVFVPQSTGVGRTAGRKAAERFLVHFNATGSIRPGDYRGLTRDASYFIALILAGRVGPPLASGLDTASRIRPSELESRQNAQLVASAVVGISLLVLVLLLGRIIRRWLVRSR